MINSKKKGSAFERQVAKEIRRSGLDKNARRRGHARELSPIQK